MAQSSTEIQIPTSAGILTGKRWGDSKLPKILAFHGWLDNAASFDRLAPLLAGFCVVAMDLAGHGLSAHRGAGAQYTLFDAVGDIDEIIDTLQWSEFYLMGHSLGGGLVSLYAGANPRTIKKVIFIDCLGPFTEETPSLPARVKTFLMERKALRSKKPPYYKTMEEMLTRRLAMGDLSREGLLPMMERGVEKTPQGFTWRADPRLRISSAQRLTEDQVRTMLSGIACPTLVLRGTKSRIFKDETILKRAESVKQLKMVSIEGDHYIHIDQVEESAREILKFLL